MAVILTDVNTKMTNDYEKYIKEHYQRTWWFHKTIQDKRDITINQLING